jgi:hypothetical protein
MAELAVYRLLGNPDVTTPVLVELAAAGWGCEIAEAGPATLPVEVAAEMVGGAQPDLLSPLEVRTVLDRTDVEAIGEHALRDGDVELQRLCAAVGAYRAEHVAELDVAVFDRLDWRTWPYPTLPDMCAQLVDLAADAPLGLVCELAAEGLPVAEVCTLARVASASPAATVRRVGTTRVPPQRKDPHVVPPPHTPPHTAHHA